MKTDAIDLARDFRDDIEDAIIDIHLWNFSGAWGFSIYLEELYLKHTL